MTVGVSRFKLECTISFKILFKGAILKTNVPIVNHSCWSFLFCLALFCLIFFHPNALHVGFKKQANGIGLCRKTKTNYGN